MPQPPPGGPGVRLNDITFELDDGKGTDFRPSKRWAGGTDTEWQAVCRFEPGLSESVRQLTIVATSPGAMPRSCVVYRASDTGEPTQVAPSG